jgi:hypothetical protein
MKANPPRHRIAVELKKDTQNILLRVNWRLEGRQATSPGDTCSRLVDVRWRADFTARF